MKSLVDVIFILQVNSFYNMQILHENEQFMLRMHPDTDWSIVKCMEIKIHFLDCGQFLTNKNILIWRWWKIPSVLLF